MPKHSNLGRVESEFVECDDEVADEAEELLSDFFKQRKGTQYKAFTEDDLRYFVVSRNGELEIIEEDGEWIEGNIEPNPENEYEVIYYGESSIETEEVNSKEAERILL